MSQLLQPWHEGTEGWIYTNRSHPAWEAQYPLLFAEKFTDAQGQLWAVLDGLPVKTTPEAIEKETEAEYQASAEFYL
jgi:hypothetical protein